MNEIDREKAKKRVIVLGASPKRSRFSNKAIRAYREAGWTVVPVHPQADRIEGLDTYPDLRSVPGRAGLLLLYLRPERALPLLEAAPELGVRRVFVNPGTGSPELLDRLAALNLEAVESCAIVALGRTPAEFPD